MNPLWREAANTAELTWLMGVMTAAFLVFFLGWVWWAYAPGRRAIMDEAARMPLTDGDEG